LRHRGTVGRDQADVADTRRTRRHASRPAGGDIPAAALGTDGGAVGMSQLIPSPGISEEPVGASLCAEMNDGL